MDKDRFNLLFKLYLDRKCTPDQEKELIQIMSNSFSDEEREKLIEECYEKLPVSYTLKNAASDRIFRRIVTNQRRKADSPFGRQRPILHWTLRIAVVILVFIVFSIFVFKDNKPANEINQVVEMVSTLDKPLYKNDIKPGGNRAVLILSDGSKILLDKVSEGTLTRQGGITIVKLDRGKLACNTQGKSENPSNADLYNTLTTPCGGQYNITLPDGTSVWLNASTTLRFPVSFTGKERKVEITGEAYFEVSKNLSIPFIVVAGNSRIKVLGTHFNVMAYPEDKIIRTTLLEGSVEVLPKDSTSSGVENSVVTLQPGQQAQLSKDNVMTVVEADIQEVIAWKNGYFIFNNENIESIMLKISRWYDVKVKYELDTENKNFTGNISRSQNVSEVLSMLELTEAVRFKIENKTITVMQ